MCRSVLACGIVALGVLAPVSVQAQKGGQDPCATIAAGDVETRLDTAARRLTALSAQIRLFRSVLDRGQILVADIEVFPDEPAGLPDDEPGDRDFVAGPDLVTTSLEDMIALRVVDSAISGDEDAFERALRGVLNTYFSYRRAMRARLAEQEAQRAQLSDCVDILRAQSRADRVAAQQGRVLILLPPEVGEAADYWPFAERRHIVIQPEEGSVRYLWDSVGSCRVQYQFSVGGVPAHLANGQEFTITMTGNASGTCNSAGGQCRAARLSLGDGLEQVEDGAPLQLAVGVPRAGQNATSDCQVGRQTASIRLRATGDQSAQLEFSIRHGSGWWSVTRYLWQPGDG